jgi:hypothetical protein
LIKKAKNVCGKHQGAKSLHEEVARQMCGYLAKRALVAFDIGDVCADSRSVGVIITPVYMQGISLKLQSIGTANAELKFERTHLFPLVDEAAFSALVKEELDKEYLRSQLFRGQNSFVGSDQVLGMQYLWELLHSSDADLGCTHIMRSTIGV